jgi:hypothetical protein
LKNPSTHSAFSPRFDCPRYFASSLEGGLGIRRDLVV